MRTDGSGHISNWLLYADTSDVGFPGTAYHTNPSDDGEFLHGFQSYGYAYGSSGTWTSDPVLTPEPAFLVPLFVGCLGLAALRPTSSKAAPRASS